MCTIVFRGAGLLSEICEVVEGSSAVQLILFCAVLDYVRRQNGCGLDVQPQRLMCANYNSAENSTNVVVLLW